MMSHSDCHFACISFFMFIHNLFLLNQVIQRGDISHPPFTMVLLLFHGLDTRRGCGRGIVQNGCVTTWCRRAGRVIGISHPIRVQFHRRDFNFNKRICRQIILVAILRGWRVFLCLFFHSHSGWVDKLALCCRLAAATGRFGSTG